MKRTKRRMKRRTKRRMKRRTKRGGKPFSAYVPTWMRFPWRKTVSAPSKPPSTPMVNVPKPDQFTEIKNEFIHPEPLELQSYMCGEGLNTRMNQMRFIDKCLDNLNNKGNTRAELQTIYTILQQSKTWCGNSQTEKDIINKSIFELRNKLRECDKTKKCEPAKEYE